MHGSLQPLNSSHVSDRDKALLGNVMVGGVWNVLLLGSGVLDKEVTGVSAAGAGVFAHQSELCWSNRRWAMFNLIVSSSLAGGSSVFPGLCRLFSGMSCGVMLALQSSDAVQVGVDNLGAVRHVGRLLNGNHGSTPCELVTDGDLLLLIDRMLHLRGHDTVRITHVPVLTELTDFSFFQCVTRLKKQFVMLMSVWFLMVGFVS